MDAIRQVVKTCIPHLNGRVTKLKMIESVQQETHNKTHKAFIDRQFWEKTPGFFGFCTKISLLDSFKNICKNIQKRWRKMKASICFCSEFDATKTKQASPD